MISDQWSRIPGSRILDPGPSDVRSSDFAVLKFTYAPLHFTPWGHWGHSDRSVRNLSLSLSLSRSLSRSRKAAKRQPANGTANTEFRALARADRGTVADASIRALPPVTLTLTLRDSDTVSLH